MMEIKFGDSGNVLSLQYDGMEFAASGAACSIFEVQLRDFIGNAYLLDVGTFASVRCEHPSSGVTEFHYSDNRRIRGTSATVTVTVCGDEARWQLEIHPGMSDFEVEWVNFPRVVLSRHSGSKFLLPVAEGTLVDDLRERERTASFKCRQADYPLTGVSSFYPGPVAMQFEAYYVDGKGLCIMCPDKAHAPKTIDAIPDGNGDRLYLQHFTGGSERLGYDVVIHGFHGDWQDAAELYRTWMEANDSYLPKKLAGRMPQWLADSPVILAYPVKGSGLDAGGLTPNEYYPYSAALPIVEKYRKLWKCRIMSLLMHWEGTAPWAPPYVWPPSGGEELMKEFVDAMHRNGDVVGLYGSGIAWTQHSMIDPSYSLKERFEKEHVEKEICIGPRGEMFSSVCNGPWGQRIGYDLCPSRDFTRKTVTHEIASAANIGIDYLQYFDQNQGGTSPFCYSRHHGHPWLPGPWQAESMRRLFDAAQEAASGRTVLGCENAAAEPYLAVCSLNDLRNHLAWGTGGVPVPLYPYLFHEYTTGFSGNGVCLGEWIDVERTPFFLQWVLAWNFASGNVLSVVLKDGGKIHWNWALPWSVPEPRQEPLVQLIANLAEWRSGRASKYLVSGRMEKSPSISCGGRKVFLRRREPVMCPAVECTAWSCDGQRAIVLANCGEKAEPCRIDFEKDESGTVLTHSGERVFNGSSLMLEIPELDAVVIELAN